VPVDEGADIGFELLDRGMNTSTEPFSGEFGKPALDLIDIEPFGDLSIDLCGWRGRN